MASQADGPKIRIGPVFLDYVRFEHREDHFSLPEGTRPVVGEVSLNVEAGVSQDGHNGMLRISVKTRPENAPIYKVELGLVALVGLPPEGTGMTIRDFLTGPGVSVFYPFVREAFASVTHRGRFGPVYLSLINAAAISAEWRKELAEAESGQLTGVRPPKPRAKRTRKPD